MWGRVSGFVDAFHLQRFSKFPGQVIRSYSSPQPGCGASHALQSLFGAKYFTASTSSMHRSPSELRAARNGLIAPSVIKNKLITDSYKHSRWCLRARNVKSASGKMLERWKIQMNTARIVITISYWMRKHRRRGWKSQAMMSG